ncbi:hypothetical protein BKA70DRAFT_1283440 [Coprinopsis sp. MPI-PUGE-AT-0042]|nr:hypothetical protein BKA70DRAFT_1283440 [Coprinopsis sp. MPI-PUGE-AT-0042]
MKLLAHKRVRSLTQSPQNGQTLTRVVVPTELIVEIMIMLVHSVRWMWAKRERNRTVPRLPSLARACQIQPRNFGIESSFHWKDLADPAAWLQEQVSNTRGQVPLALQAHVLRETSSRWTHLRLGGFFLLDLAADSRIPGIELLNRPLVQWSRLRSLELANPDTRLSLHLPRRPEMPLLTSLTMKCVGMDAGHNTPLLSFLRSPAGEDVVFDWAAGWYLDRQVESRGDDSEALVLDRLRRFTLKLYSSSNETPDHLPKVFSTANCPNIEALEVEFIINRAYRCDHDGTFLTLLADQIGLVARWSNSLTTLTLNNTGGPPCALENLLYMCSALRHLNVTDKLMDVAFLESLNREHALPFLNTIRLEVLLDLWFVNSAQDFRMLPKERANTAGLDVMQGLQDNGKRFSRFVNERGYKAQKRTFPTYPTASWSARIISKQYTVKRMMGRRFYTGGKRHMGAESETRNTWVAFPELAFDQD